MTLDNNNAVLTDFSLNTLPDISVSLTRCISIFFSFEYFDPYYYYMLRVGSL